MCPRAPRDAAHLLPEQSSPRVRPPPAPAARGQSCAWGSRPAGALWGVSPSSLCLVPKLDGWRGPLQRVRPGLWS